MDLSKALSHGFPGKKWALNGNTLAGLIWMDEGDAPTQAQVNAAWNDFIVNGTEPATVEKIIEDIFAFQKVVLEKGIVTQEEIEAKKGE